MITELHTSKLWLTTDGRLEVYDQRLALRFNRYFKKYDDGKYPFQPGEEAVFKVVSQVDYKAVLGALKRKKSTPQKAPVP